MSNYESLIEKVGGIKKAKAIVEGAPEDRSFISGKILPADGFDVKHGKYVMCDGVYKFHYTNGWDIHSYAWHDFVLNVVDLNNLRTAIAQHEQGSNSSEFKVGDLVVRLDLKSSPIFELTHAHHGINYFYACQVGLSCTVPIDIRNLRHATPSEIKAGRRLDHSVDVTDMVTDIRNHISPNTKVINHG